MKNKILPFIIGFLVGAILATGGFYLYENSKTPNDVKGNFKQEMKGAPDENFDGETPPDMQDGDNNSKDGTRQNKRQNTKSSNETENATTNSQV